MDAIAASATVRLAVFSLGWALMIVAMMLPTTLPLLGSFRRLTASRNPTSHYRISRTAPDPLRVRGRPAVLRRSRS